VNARWTAFALIVLLFGAAALTLPTLPARVPIHWNVAGEPDGWASAWVGVFALPLVGLGMWGLLVGIRSFMDLEERAAAVRFLDALILGLTIAWTMLHGLILASYRGWPLPMDLTALAFLVMGGFLVWTGRWMVRLGESDEGLVLVSLPTDDRELKREVLGKGAATMVWAGATMAAAAAFGPRARLILVTIGIVPAGVFLPIWALWKAARSG